MISYDMIVSNCCTVANPLLKSGQWKCSHLTGNANNHILSSYSDACTKAVPRV